MDIETLLRLCKSWDALGTAVQKQLADVLEGQPIGDQNANAMKLVASFLEICAKRGVDGAEDLRDSINFELESA